ncbi:3-hydroxyacyl-CoA dehydrogenase family protein [Enterococcus faecalis]|uniref:3-hydroxyacyl-CoA dehydrogenase, NAD binding domain protein n=1 Tax=Enterococcus faecalis RP2S-4 TaxID=1244145 RepID=A0ABC9TJW9_ENTFL|nr:3-hydroxyacyl-CoA dehydrogenase family protein [Enterococcus faecalis]EPI09086.1 3-hydroxyacyl-CoA dehydrogenase, NAD binding domain protein [Enterococcus faecalis RP2S-4]
MNIRKVVILGGNGKMGRNVGGVFASFGEAEVYLVARKYDDAKLAVEKAAKSLRSSTVTARIVPKTYEDLNEIIPTCDLVFESVAENLFIKQKVYEQVGSFLNETTIIATGTSGLSINKLSRFLPEKLQKNYLGLHFFNPPYQLPFCEIIPCKKTRSELVTEMFDYSTEELKRATIFSKDQPAFVGNRIGFQFLNYLLQKCEEYSNYGGIDYIDAIFSGYTGRGMAPAVTVDFVGLDVHKAIVDNVYANVPTDYVKDTFVVPSFVNELIELGQRGIKDNGGLYKYIEGESFVYDIHQKIYRPLRGYELKNSHEIVCLFRDGLYQEGITKLLMEDSIETNLIIECLIMYSVYAINIAKTVGQNIISADIAMAKGFNWLPPLNIVELFGGKDQFITLAKERLGTELIDAMKIESALKNAKPPQFDYRRFLWAK